MCGGVSYEYCVILHYQDEVDQATSIEELEKQIEKLAKVCPL